MSKCSSRSRIVVCFAVFGLCSAAERVCSQDKPPVVNNPPEVQFRDMPEAPLPEGLRNVPDHAIGFVHFRVGDFLRSDGGKTLVETLQRDPELAKQFKTLDKDLGLALADIDSVTLVFLDSAMLRGDNSRDNAKKSADALRELGNSVNKFKDGAPVPKFQIGPKNFPDFKVPEGKKGPPTPPREKNGKQSSRLERPLDLRKVEMIATEESETEAHFVGSPLHEALWIITASKALDRRKLLTTHVLGRESARLGDYSILFLSDRSFMLGEREKLAEFIKPSRNRSAPDGLPLMLRRIQSPDANLKLHLAAQPHLIVAGFTLPHFDAQHMEPNLLPLLPLMNVSSVGITLDLDKAADLKINLQYTGNERNAALASEAAKTALVMVDIGLEEYLDKTKKNKRPLPLEILAKKLRKSLAAASVEHKGSQVRVALKMDADPETIVQGFMQMVDRVQAASSRVHSQGNLKQIALAMHTHHDVFRHFPPAGIGPINDKDGKPLLSWRVALLPYIEQAPLYEQFDMTLPWDHPHNKKLIARMPQIYMLPGAKTKEPWMTHYQVFVGQGTAFDPRQFGGVRLTEITDGTSNTIMLAEAANPVIWTKPEDLPFDPDPKSKLPKLGGVFEGGFNVAFCDGSVRFMRDTISAETLRALITMNGGEAVSPPED